MRSSRHFSHFVNQLSVRSHQVLRATRLLYEPTIRRPHQPSRPASMNVGSSLDSAANELQNSDRLP